MPLFEITFQVRDRKSGETRGPTTAEKEFPDRTAALASFAEIANQFAREHSPDGRFVIEVLGVAEHGLAA